MVLIHVQPQSNPPAIHSLCLEGLQMGNTISPGGRVAGSRKGPRQSPLPERCPDGCCSASAWFKAEESQQPSRGTLETCKGTVRWALPTPEMLAAAPPLGLAKGSRQLQCMALSPRFSMPSYSVPHGCTTIAGTQEWQLCWEGAHAKDSPVMSLFLGCPTLASDPRWSQLGICAEFRLDVRVTARGAADGSQNSCCFHRREWLSHAFAAEQPDWGLAAVLPLAELGSQQTDGSQLLVEVEVRFEGVTAHLQGELAGLVLHDSPLLLQISQDPAILAMDGFLDPQECQALKDLAGPLIQRSRVSVGDQTPLRTSWGMFITGQLAAGVVARQLDAKVQHLADLGCRLKGRKPLELGEATQIVRYHEGDFYAPHYDNKAGDCARRAATIMVYLSDVEAGGTTYFPRSSGFPRQRALEACVAGSNNHPAAPPRSPSSAAGQVAEHAQQQEGAGGREPPGLHIIPRQGRAVMFWSRLPNGREDKASIHAAEPGRSHQWGISTMILIMVGPESVKWIATRWCRES